MTSFDSYSSDDDEDKCPLCIEDMDITDKNFKPCPCGFQICQFCYNNIRSGPEQYNRCPACRRPYDDASIQYKTLTAEEMKQEQERKQRKELARKHREREKNKDFQHHHHYDQRDKKHLANVRVIQKNLVYVIGLNPNIPSEDLQTMLRRDEYFGQYGKIQKIVVNKRVNGNGNLGVGVYVTYARKEDAARCIAAVDGSVNDGKYLRAAYGTTKYCSSYLRGQNCPNGNCMFLHEPGEEADSFNRHPNQQGNSGPLSMGNHSASASPVPAHSTLSYNAASSPTPAAAATSGLASLSAHSGGAGAAAVPGLASSTGASAGTAMGASVAPVDPRTSPQMQNMTPQASTLTAANAPALPAWGKVTPQIPHVHKLLECDLPNTAADSLRLLERNLASLSTESWSFQFVSEIVDSDAKFPAMFSLPMDDKRRLKAYNKAIAELDRLAAQTEAQKTPEPSAESGDSRLSVGASTPTSEDSKADIKKNNSQHLLAHLMRGVSPSPAPAERHEEASTVPNREQPAVADRSATPSIPKDQLATPRATGVAPAPLDVVRSKDEASETASDDTVEEVSSSEFHQSNADEVKEEDKTFNQQAAVAMIEKFQHRSDIMHGTVAATLRRVGGELMQPAPVPQAPVAPEPDTSKGRLVDDGPAFDLRNIPRVEIAGDTHPSVWSAIEVLSRDRDTLVRKEKEFAAAKAQTKKRIKRLRV